MHTKTKVAGDPFSVVPRVTRTLKTNWLRWTYPFFFFGKGVKIDLSCEIPRAMTPEMSIGDGVYLAPDAWLTVIPGGSDEHTPKLVIGDRCSIGKRTSISAHRNVVLESSVLIGPSVVIMDYNHEFSNPDEPIRDQGVTEGGRVIIERNCWIGQGAAILCGRGELVIGRNSVIGCNSVVTRSCPPHSVLVGNPARLVRRYDPQTARWIKADMETAAESR